MSTRDRVIATLLHCLDHTAEETTVVLCPLGLPPMTFAVPARGPASLSDVEPAPDARSLAPASERATPDASGCVGDLIKVLRAAGRRLTVQKLLEALRERTRANGDVQAWSETKVSNTATAFICLGLLTTSKVTNPPGYGLLEWGEGPGPMAGPSLPPHGMTHASRNGDGGELVERWGATPRSTTPAQLQPATAPACSFLHRCGKKLKRRYGVETIE